MKTYYDILYSIKDKSFDDWKLHLFKHDITSRVVEKIDQVPQSTYFHPEFDTLKHVYYVCRAVCDINMAKELLEAAFLHDVGKGQDTNIGGNRIYSYGHAKTSAKYVEDNRQYLKSDFETTHDIVSRHMDFNDWNSDKLSIDENSLLRHFIFCDKEKSTEIYLKESSYVERLLNKIKEYQIFRKQRKSKKKIIALVGISGSGKSTYVESHFNESDVFCPDELRKKYIDITNNEEYKANFKEVDTKVWHEIYELIHTHLETNDVAVLDATNTVKFLRLKTMSRFNGIRKEAILFDADPEITAERVQDDLKAGKIRAEVPKGSIKRQFKALRMGLRSLPNEFNKVTVVSGLNGKQYDFKKLSFDENPWRKGYKPLEEFKC